MREILNKIKAGYPGLYLLSNEEQRTEAMLLSVSKDLDYKLWAWSVEVGLDHIAEGDSSNHANGGPDEVLLEIRQLDEKSIIVLRDFHLFFSEPNPILIRRLKDSLLHAKTANKTIIIVAPVFKLPIELEKMFAVVEFSLPTREELGAVLKGLCDSTEKPMPEGEDLEKILDSASGLTTPEAEDAFALSLVEEGTFSPVIISREKCNAVKKGGLLEVIESKITINDIGGLEILKEDLVSKKNIFTKAAKDYGLPTPRGILTCGNPGTGKSLTATACGNIFGVPLLQLEAGSLFGSLVGQTEQNWRTVHATAKALAPVVLWIDEVDGLFSGGKSSGQTDGGTTQRVIKAMLQDMQFDSEGVFYVFTCNDIDQLPDALIDRLDVWSVDLPTYSERQSIWKIHIAKRGRKAEDFNVDHAATLTDGFSGRQIEQVWLKAMTLAFNEEREPRDIDIEAAAKKFVPTSETMKETIEARRKRLANRATPASKPGPSKPLVVGRKISTQEKN